MDETPKTPTRKPRKDKGVPRASRTNPVGSEQGAPIFVRIVLKDGITSEFGCARRFQENGFHVFIYPSRIDRYRETRREFAISEVVELEITEARQTYDLRAPVQGPALSTQPSLYVTTPPAPVLDMTPHQNGKPKIHSVRAAMRARGGESLVEKLSQSEGPVPISAEELSGALGVGASVAGIGDHSG